MPASSSQATFVGRAAELGALVDAYARAAAGRGTTALVGGEAGVGKSRLVDELAAHARRRGARVLVGQCLDLEEGGMPYAPAVDILHTLERELTPEQGAATLGPLRALLGHGERPGGAADAPASRGPPVDQVGQARLFELLLTVVERLVEAGPLVLVVEDLHWADRSTLDLVALVASGTRALPVMTVGTYRTDDVPPGHPLRSVTAELTRRGARHLRLERLGAGEVAELLGALLAEPPSAEVTARVVERSDGNPLFVEELAAALADDPDAPMPPHLRDAVISRVERLGDTAAAVLRACAAGGREVEHDLLADAVGADADVAGADPGSGTGGRPGGGAAVVPGLDAAGLDRALRACVDRGLLTAHQRRGTYRFRHALMHEAVLGDILPGELHRLHRSYATALDRRQGVGGRDRSEQGWARLAHHWEAAAEFDAALGAAVRAGRAAGRAFAVPEAYRYLEWSVRLWDRARDPGAASGCDRADLLARTADAANLCGAIGRALSLVDEALASSEVAGDPVRAGLLHERRGWYLYRDGRDADALAASELAVGLVPARPPSPARARVVQAHAHALVRAGRNAAARTCADEALELARAVGDVADEGQARHVIGLVLATEGRTDEAIAALHEAGRIAADRGDLAEVAGAYVHLWRTLVEAGRGGDLVELLAAVGASDRPDDAPTLMGSIGAAALHQLGRWDEADRLLGDGRRPAGSGGLTDVARTLVAGALAVDRGDHDRARDDLETARAWCHQVGDGRLNGLLHRALAELAAWQGRYGDARREVATGLELLAHTGDPELAARLAAVGVRVEADRAARARRARGSPGRRPTAEHGAGTPGDAAVGAGTATRAAVGAGTMGGAAVGAGTAAGAPTAAGASADAEWVARRLVARLAGLAATTIPRNAPPTSEAAAALRTGQAELTRLLDRPDPPAWRRAVDVWDAIGFPYPAAYARLRLAEAALAADRTLGDEAAAALTSSWDTARTLGARPLADAVARLARRARFALARADDALAEATAATAAPGAVDLTPREREVLALVAEGNTNRQIGERLFISQKTASVHVSRLLAKLGATTRGEAAAIARRAGLVDDRPAG